MYFLMEKIEEAQSLLNEAISLMSDIEFDRIDTEQARVKIESHLRVATMIVREVRDNL